MKKVLSLALLLVACSSGAPKGNSPDEKVTLLNASFDASRELFRDVNEAFVRNYEQRTGRKVEIKMSHAGSGKQARAVIDGLEADVVTLALAQDVDEIVRRSGAVRPGWRDRSPYGGSPFTSTVVFVVRKGNPKGIRDWPDLVKPGVEVIATNPKTGGGARWSYLAAWGAAKARLGSDEQARAWVEELYGKHVPIFDSGARGSSNTFGQRGIGDVLLSWESEAFMLARELPDAGFETVVPSTSIVAEPAVAVVDRVVDRRGTREVAEAYVAFLATEEAQQIIARNGFRPRADVASPLPKVPLFTIDDTFGGWDRAQATHFADGATFDAITGKR